MPDNTTLNSSTYGFEALRRDVRTCISQEISDWDKVEVGKELACAMENVEALETELRKCILLHEISDLEKPEIGKKLARAMKIVEAIKSELRTYILIQKSPIWGNQG